MIDFIKIQVIQPPILKLLEHEDLDFKVELNLETAEIHSHIKEADHRNLKFTIVEGRYLNISGSLHKFWHNGINHDDYGYEQLKETIEYLQVEFGINPETCVVRNLEFGVNVDTIEDPHWFMRRMIDYKGSAFSKMKARNRNIGICCYLKQYGLKIYNKGLQCNLDQNNLRIELKVTRMAFVKKTGIITLSDLLNQQNLIHLGNILVESLSKVLMYDPEIKSDSLNQSIKELYLSGQSPLFWENLKSKKDPSFHYKRSKFKEICSLYGETKQSYLMSKVSNKWTTLLNS